MTLQDRHRSLGVLIALVVAALLPSPAHAGPSRLGDSFNASGPVGVGSKVTDIAHDPGNDVYLMVSGSRVYDGGHVYGRFIQGDGTLLGGLFRIPETAAFTQLPRVAYSAALGGFLVTWIDTRANPALGQVWGRFVKHGGGGGPAFTTGDFMIDSVTGGTQPEVAAAVACAGAKPECLVAWHNRGGGAEAGNDIHAVRVNLSGQAVGTELFLTNDNNWQTLPAVGYDPANGVYLVAVQTYSHTGGIWAYRVQADSGSVLGNSVLAEGGELYKPEIAFNVQSGQFLVSWLHSNSKVWSGRFIKSDGTVGNIIPLLAGYGGYDANGLAYNPTSGSFLGVTHGNSVEDIAYEVSGAGVPSDAFQVTATGGGGNFYPRVAAHNGRSEWLMTASSGFTFVAGQRITTDTTGGPGGGGGGGGGGGDTELIDLSQSGAPNGSWFLAEGVAQNTANGFITFYLIVNENSVPVNVRGYFSREDGKTFSRTFTVAANARHTLNLAAEFGVGTFGAVFQSLDTEGRDIFVERSIYWGPNLEGSTSEVATRSLAFEWYFGEGSRDFFSNYFLLFNPNQVGGSATFTFFLENGTQVERVLSFGPQQRVTMDAMSVSELAAQNFGVRVKSTVPVVAERAMYFGLGPNGFIGGTASIGAPGAWNHWLFAEGAAAPGFHTFYLLMNPNQHEITVNRRLYLENGTQLTGEEKIPAGSRKTIYLNNEMGHIGGASAYFYGNDKFIAERSIYWGANGWVEGTNVIGSTTFAADWHVPEGTETGDFDSFLLILNATEAPVTADIILYIEGLGRFTAPESLRPVIPAGARKTINMRDFLTQMEQAGGHAPGYLANTSFSTRVRTTGGEGIVVEHALYRTFDGDNRWRSGSASFGVPR